MTDLDQYLPAIAAGDPEAFALWVAGCEHRLRASLSRFAERIDVEAVVQETLLRVWQVAQRIRLDGRPESSVRFAIRVGHNLAISETRRLAGGRAIEVTFEHEPSTHPAQPDPLLREHVQRCYDKLRGKPALALRQRLESSAQPDRALAAAIGMQLDAFLQNISRARKAIFACLAKSGVDLEVGG